MLNGWRNSLTGNRILKMNVISERFKLYLAHFDAVFPQKIIGLYALHKSNEMRCYYGKNQLHNPTNVCDNRQ